METNENSGFTDAFSDYWWRGVRIAGYDLFGDGTEENFEAATDKDQLRPNFKKLYAALSSSRKTYAEELFIVLMCGFFNDTATDQLLSPKLERLTTLGRSAYLLDRDRREVIAALLLTYSSW